jgi:hypothetical protein
MENLKQRLVGLKNDLRKINSGVNLPKDEIDIKIEEETKTFKLLFNQESEYSDRNKVNFGN